MVLAALSPNSVLATPIQVNPQVKTDLQTSMPQAVQDAQRAVKTMQTDTVTISLQALKMADDKGVFTKKTDNKPDAKRTLQLAGDKADDVTKARQRNAGKAYAAVSSYQ